MDGHDATGLVLGPHRRWFGDDWTIDRVDQQRRIFVLGEPPHFALHKTKWN